jgi:hypothetical protein
MVDIHISRRGDHSEVKNWEDIENALTDHSGNEPKRKGDEYIHDCPFCDKPGHLYVNYVKGVYNCYRCGGDNPDGRGNIFKLAELLGVTAETDELDLSQGASVEQLDQDLAAIYISGEGIVPTGEVTYDRNEMPIQPPGGMKYIDITTWYERDVQTAVAYLAGRGITGQHLYHYKLGVCVHWNRTKVVFTDFNRYGQLRWWQTRHVEFGTDPQWLRRGPKYLGPSGDKAGKIGNWYQAIQQPVDYVGVAEGPISGMVAGLEFTWLWGKEHSKEQLDVLLSADKLIVIAMDGEAKAFKNAIGLATEVRSRGGQSIIVPMPGDHDPASLGVEKFRPLLTTTLRNRDRNDLDFLERVVNDYV